MQREEEKKEEERRQADLRRQKEEAEKNRLEEFRQLYGQLSRSFSIENPYDAPLKIYVFEDVNKIVINNIPYSFSDIISVDIFDNQQTKIVDLEETPRYLLPPQQKMTTKTSTKNLVGRAVVGGLLFGGIGAVVGAATAKKEQIIPAQRPNLSQPVHIVIHNYNLAVTINSVQQSSLNIRIGNNQRLAEDLFSLFKVICNRNSDDFATNQ